MIKTKGQVWSLKKKQQKKQKMPKYVDLNDIFWVPKIWSNKKNKLFIFT